MSSTNKIHYVLPMAGGGTRFKKEGFDVPKPLIKLQGKPFFYWAVQSILKFVDVEDLIFVVLKEHIEKYRIDTEIKNIYPNAKLQVIPEVLNGAVLSCCEGLKQVNDDLPILFNDCDHAFICNSFYNYLKDLNTYDNANVDAGLLTFKSDSSKYSYVKFDENHNVIGTVEKIVESDEAICGAYYFRNKNLFLNSVESYLHNCEYLEYFVSGVYNEIVKGPNNIKTFMIDEHISFGTPSEYKMAANDNRLNYLL